MKSWRLLEKKRNKKPNLIEVIDSYHECVCKYDTLANKYLELADKHTALQDDYISLLKRTT